MATTKLSLKLLIDTKANKVVFAEAGKDFVDFLFGLLAMPVGSVVKLLQGKCTVGCLGNVYQSLGNLDNSYMQRNLSKDILLNPKSSNNVPLLMGHDSRPPQKYYTCNQHHGYITNEIGSSCPQCYGYHQYESNKMTRELVYRESNNTAVQVTTTANGYVQGLVMYMVSDDLMVTPLSMVSSITMMNKCNLSKLDVLEERVVEVSFDEGLEFLKASFQTNAALTAVFLGNKGSAATESGSGELHLDHVEKKEAKNSYI